MDRIGRLVESGILLVFFTADDGVDIQATLDTRHITITRRKKHNIEN
jgi:hypothetical protein